MDDDKTAGDAAKNGGAGDSQDRKAAESYGRPEPADLGRYVRLTLWGLLALLAVLFLIGNGSSVEVSFVFTTVNIPLFVALIIAMIFGACLGLLGLWIGTHRREKAKKVAAKIAGDFKKKS
jgi:uncharacterized integral membrane protein